MQKRCQITTLPYMSEKLSLFQTAWQRVKKLRCTFGRRISYLKNFKAKPQREDGRRPAYSKTPASPMILKPGDLVRVRTEKEIRKTLNRWNQLKGCGIMDDMWKYCGTEQRVFKIVKQFLDERDYLVKKCNGIVILQDVLCEGTKWFGRCDRSCYYFWREEWIERVDVQMDGCGRPQAAASTSA